MFELHASKVTSLKNDMLSGLTVALALVPEAVAFAFVAGVEPLVGLYAALYGGINNFYLWWSSWYDFRSNRRNGRGYGQFSCFAWRAIFICNGRANRVLQILAGIFRLGKFIRLVPHPVMLGFVNGLAIVIFLAQLGQFKVMNEDGIFVWMQGSQLWTMAGLLY